MRLKEPRNLYESILWKALKEGGWELLKNGWPDIIAVKDDRVAVFEVKAKRSERLKEEQLRCMDFLSRAEVECYRWDKDVGFAPYGETLPDVKTLNTLREKRKKWKAQRICPICKGQKTRFAIVCYKCEGNPVLREKIEILRKEKLQLLRKKLSLEMKKIIYHTIYH